MKINYFINSLFGIMTMLMSSTVSATLFNFNGSNLGVVEGVYDSLTMTVDGVGVDITAFTISNGSNTLLVGSDVGVYFEKDTDGSLGVKSSSGDGRKMDGGDGLITDPDEGLLLSFDTQVRFDYIDFDSFDVRRNDDFNLTIDGIHVLTDFNGNQSSPLVSIFDENDPKLDKYNFHDLVGKEFLFWADDGSDSFLIDELRVTAVPIPAAFLLFTTGLAWFGLMRAKYIS